MKLKYDVVIGSRIRFVMILYVMLSDVVIVSLCIIGIGISSSVMNDMNVVISVSMFGISRLLKLWCVVLNEFCLCVILWMMKFICCMLCDMLIVNMRNGMSIVSGLRLKLSSFNVLNCYMSDVSEYVISSIVKCIEW